MGAKKAPSNVGNSAHHHSYHLWLCHGPGLGDVHVGGRPRQPTAAVERERRHGRRVDSLGWAALSSTRAFRGCCLPLLCGQPYAPWLPTYYIPTLRICPAAASCTCVSGSRDVCVHTCLRIFWGRLKLHTGRLSQAGFDPGSWRRVGARKLTQPWAPNRVSPLACLRCVFVDDLHDVGVGRISVRSDSSALGQSPSILPTAATTTTKGTRCCRGKKGSSLPCGR